MKKSIKLNAILNVLKSTCGVVIPMITYPYVSRVLGVSNYGKYGFSESIVTMLAIIASLGIPTYAVREGARYKDDPDKLNKFCSEVFNINLMSLAISLLLLVVLRLTSRKISANWILICLLTINTISNVVGREWITSIFEDFLYITIRYLIFQLISVVTLFVFVKGPSNLVVYAFTVVLANASGYLFNILYVRKYVPYLLRFKLNLKKHLIPILYLFGVNLAIQVYIKSDIVILGFLTDDNSVGLYTLVSRIYSVVKMVLNAIIMVAIPRVSLYLGKRRIDEYNELLNNLRKYLYTMALPCIVGLFFESKNIMLLMGGAEYLDGSRSLQILCLALFFAVFGCFYSQGVIVPNRKDKVFFFATLTAAVINIGFNFVLIPFWGIEAAALTTVMAEICVFSICRVKSRKLATFSIRSKDFIAAIVGCIIIGFCCSIVNQIQINGMIQLAISIVLSILLYLVVLSAFKSSIVTEMLSFVKNIRRGE